MIYAIFTGILFLFILNGFMKGRLKQQTDIMLTMLIMGIVIWGIFAKGWPTLVYFVAIWLIGGNFILTPLAKIVAKRLRS